MKAETPVVLVHGFLSTRQLMLPFKWQLARYGYQVSQPALSFLCIQDVRQLADQLARAVDEQCRQHDVDQVDLVGISQGGIIGLYYLLHRGGSARIRRLVMVGSPVRGSYAALGGLPLLGLVSKGIRQIRPGAAFLETLAHDLPTGARVMTISVVRDLVAPPARCAVESAEQNVVIDGPLGPFKHQWIAMSPAVVRHVDRLLSVD